MTALQAKLQAAHDAQAIAALRADVEASRAALRACLDALRLSQTALSHQREANLALRKENQMRMGLPVDIDGVFL